MWKNQYFRPIEIVFGRVEDHISDQILSPGPKKSSLEFFLFWFDNPDKVTLRFILERAVREIFISIEEAVAENHRAGNCPGTRRSVLNTRQRKVVSGAGTRLDLRLTAERLGLVREERHRV